jgi:hypothetical protein
MTLETIPASCHRQFLPRVIKLLLSMKNLLFGTAMFVSFGLSFLYADEKPLFAPRPAKDSVASKNRAQGAGIFEMNIEKPSGKVKEVYVRSSTKNVTDIPLYEGRTRL